MINKFIYNPEVIYEDFSDFQKKQFIEWIDVGIRSSSNDVDILIMFKYRSRNSIFTNQIISNVRYITERDYMILLQEFRRKRINSIFEKED